MRTAPRFAMERLVALDRAIRAGEFPNSVTFADIIEVDPRTVQRDIEFLRDRFNAPVSFDRGRNGYYSNPDFRLSFLELEEGELIALFLAEGVLKQYAGTPYARDLASACRKIAAGITSPSPGELAASHSFHASTAVPVDSAIFHSLETAIRLRSRLAIRYYTASRDVESDREIDPYHIANIDGDFYLIAFCHHRQSIRTFSPSRIRAALPTGGRFDAPTDFNIDAYLAESFSVLRGEGESYRVRLQFAGESVRYVRERTWHPSQAIDEMPDGTLVLALTVGHLREVERFALSWGADCRVLEPEPLRVLVAQGLALAASQYEGLR